MGFAPQIGIHGGVDVRSYGDQNQVFFSHRWVTTFSSQWCRARSSATSSGAITELQETHGSYAIKLGSKEDRGDPRTYLDILSNFHFRHLKHSRGFNGIQTHDLCDAGAMF